ncbi:MAG: ribonuclease T [Thioalkalivibrionaceae bacterium]
MAARFRGFLPVVVDVETGGVDCRRHPLLEIAAVFIERHTNGRLIRGRTVSFHVRPAPGLEIDPESLAINGIKPDSPLRQAIAKPEDQALGHLFAEVRREIRDNACKRAILVGHNAHFDLGFVHAAAERAGIRRNPFHPFSCLDTVTLSAMGLGHTVLARATRLAGIDFSADEAHSAAYDAEKTADLFCEITNRWQAAIGVPEAALALPEVKS